ncbi:WLM domain-containing protein [Phlyctochytrium arcticum]|nr:WLM domain-containing protein [Phlyctochytrium arcticum]
MTVFNECIGEVKVLQRQDRKEEALELLKRVASIVKPVMKKRSWHVPVVREFLPTTPNLLGVNVNRGKEIRIRLRPHGDENRFLEFDDLVGTMLHELTHIVHGPHNAAFYKFLDELYTEYESHVDNGWTGEGFSSAGSRVGTGVSHNLPDHLAKKRALDEAEKRRKLSVLMGGMAGGKRLGGNGPAGIGRLEKDLGPAAMAAMAAERRQKDAIWCGSAAAGEGVERSGGEGSVAGGSISSNDLDPHVPHIPSRPVSSSSKSTSAAVTANPVKIQSSSSTKAQSEKRKDVVPGHDLTGVRTPKKNVTITVDLTSPESSPKRPRFIITSASIPSSSSENSIPVASIPETTFWTCPSCTLTNRPLALQCDCCLSQRPPDPENLSSTHPAGHVRAVVPSHNLWNCPACTLVNEATIQICSACNFLRDS